MACTPEKRALIEREIRALEARHDIRIILCVESGSRTAGLHAPESDHDVRGLYVCNAESYRWNPKPQYKDTIHHMVDAEHLDFELWEVRFALTKIAENKFVPMEWARSPLVYVNHDGFAEQLIAAVAKATAGSNYSELRHHNGMLGTYLRAGKISAPVSPEFKELMNQLLDTVANTVQRLKDAGKRADLTQLQDEAQSAIEAINAVCAIPIPTRTSDPVPDGGASTLTAKKYMYAILPALKVHWILHHHTPAPFAVDELVAGLAPALPDPVLTQIAGIIAVRRTAAKGEWRERDPLVDTWLLATQDLATAELRRLAEGRTQDKTGLYAALGDLERRSYEWRHGKRSECAGAAAAAASAGSEAK